MINKFIQQTNEFHTAFGVKLDVELRYKLLQEELKEYKEAYSFENKVKELIDILYIACGTVDQHKWDVNGWRYYNIPDLTENALMLYIDESIEDYYAWSDKLDVKNIIHYSFDLAKLIGVYEILPELFDEVHRSNMSKLENGKPLLREDGKILKGKDYKEADIKSILEKYGIS